MTTTPPAFHEYRPAGWLRVTGSDGNSFLQGQFTNDIRLIAPNRAVYGLWLDQKGKVLADSFVMAGSVEGEFWIGSYFSPGETIRRRLEDYIVADDVIVEDLTPDWAGMALIGPGAGAWAAESGRPGLVFPGRRAGVENWEWVFPLSALPGARAQLAESTEVSAAEMERSRIAGVIPAVPADIGPHDLPNEGGLDESAISATKGCYLGQEIIARLKSKGRIRRQLFRVAGRGAVPALPAPLHARGPDAPVSSPDRAAGELRSAAGDRDGAGFTGLAMLTLGGLVKTEKLHLPEQAGNGRTVEII